MLLTNAFDAPRSPDETFALLLDPRAIVHCVPGAEFLGEENGAFKGRISVRLGPVVLKFNGIVEISAVDPAARTAVITITTMATIIHMAMAARRASCRNPAIPGR